jgi:hypothetical protein
VIDDFRQVSMFVGGKETVKNLKNQDKGQAGEVKAICCVVLGGTDAPIALNDLAATTRTTFRIMDSLRTGVPHHL